MPTIVTQTTRSTSGVAPAVPTDALSVTDAWGDPDVYQFADPGALLAAGAASGRAEVQFASEGVTVSGHLYRRAASNGPAPAVVLLGPMTFVKGQAPAEYARRLAAAGFIALTL